MKRLFDVSIAAVMLILAAPSFVIVALALKLASRGPILSRHLRLGLHGLPFEIFKFRTMMEHAAETATGPVFKLKDDPRISRFGRFLRTTGVEELPCLLNILRGDMSFVGPRAALPLEVEHYSERERRRLELKPGLTGYWQVFGREVGANDFHRMIEMDLEYADKQSIALDLKIFLRTILVAFKGGHGY